ncbi:lipopolysaccharide-induced tumor necrosis factor-alpha factor homolog isoform X1 [Micropterus dolomieu]|uniref:lipopolysaccharide-induced tumor necrosis factor-alpha factor homolog isoform X1 n=1 Tax=Micropterus dolomieu TaxID=147949 RepID=UPI001E8D8B04|nr:lipopolysaccharide-induced tumor necrosis factor-alpha factor homolog isoform X1 [Micropterus dolomieu]
MIWIWNTKCWALGAQIQQQLLPELHCDIYLVEIHLTPCGPPLQTSPQSPPPYAAQAPPPLQPFQQAPLQQVQYQAQQGPVIQMTPQPVQMSQPQPVQVMICSGDLGDVPTVTTCKNCGQRIETRVVYQSGILAWIICGLCLVFGLWCGCCVIPFFVDRCKDAHHYCSKCNVSLGIHKRM